MFSAFFFTLNYDTFRILCDKRYPISKPVFPDSPVGPDIWWNIFWTSTKYIPSTPLRETNVVYLICSEMGWSWAGTIGVYTSILRRTEQDANYISMGYLHTVLFASRLLRDLDARSLKLPCFSWIEDTVIVVKLGSIVNIRVYKQRWYHLSI